MRPGHVLVATKSPHPTSNIQSGHMATSHVLVATSPYPNPQGGHLATGHILVATNL